MNMYKRPNEQFHISITISITQQQLWEKTKANIQSMQISLDSTQSSRKLIIDTNFTFETAQA